MSAVTAPVCICFGPISDELRLCESCHVYSVRDRKIPSVNQIVRAVWPVKKNFEDAPPHVLEHARERGVRLDRHFSAWLRGEDLKIPAGGEWEEVTDKLVALCDWWNEEFPEGVDVKPQVMVTDNEVAGTMDILVTLKDGTKIVYDLKTVWTLDATYQLTTAGYMDLAGAQYGGLIHVVQPKVRGERGPVKITMVDIDDSAVEDWRLTKNFWRMAQKRAGKL